MASKIRKARIAEGYPKLAQYIGKSWDQNDYTRRTRYFPSCYRASYGDIPYKMTNGEPIVIVNRSWRENSYHFIPLKLFAENKVPINAALTWARHHNKLPIVLDTEFTVL